MVTNLIGCLSIFGSEGLECIHLFVLIFVMYVVASVLPSEFRGDFFSAWLELGLEVHMPIFESSTEERNHVSSKH